MEISLIFIYLIFITISPVEKVILYLLVTRQSDILITCASLNWTSVTLTTVPVPVEPLPHIVLVSINNTNGNQYFYVTEGIMVELFNFDYLQGVPQKIIPCFGGP